MNQAVIVSAVRTPIGKFQGGLSSFRAPELGARVVREALQRAGVTGEQLDEVIMGNVLQAGVGQNPARQAAIFAEVPPRVPAFTVNKVCGSGLKSVMLAAQAIRAGDAEIIVAGGMECMSQAPYLVPSARNGARLGHAQLVDAMIWDGLWDVYNNFHMGNTAELVTQKYSVTREMQDAFAAESQRRAVAAIQSGKFKAEIVPVEIRGKKGEVTVVDTDEGPRADSTAAALAKLKPAFKPDGSVTAGNASTINDGAAALVVMSEEKAAKLGKKPLARITGYATGGVAPEWVMMAPVEAVKNLNAKLHVQSSHYDLVELNEAFAAQAVAVSRECGFDASKVNVNGGAVALGHPIGASGARVLVTLLHAMADRKARTGLAALCLGGGNAVALAVERMA
ncbi:MAG: acetyl-CoA C-acetyltransferase [Planctomycetes bacterium]|nr:acetyl-CoA C-acetyltransferase [Planctomycetota bacterium]MBI3844733.1 acetyl-CoA C-acetyltransferase [Planctomycetota bacterium]